jgi:hypothetical protein
LKLAEGLAERGDCQKRIEELRKRIARCTRVQEGEQPPENATELLEEAGRIFNRLLQLVQSINRTNATTPFDGGKTISDALAQREIAGKRRDFLVQIAESAGTRQDRYSKSEVKFIATVSVGELQKQADRLSKEFRELDTRIQELNWKADIIEESVAKAD